MMARRLVIAGICLAVLIAAAAVLLDRLAASPGTASARETSSNVSPGPVASGTPSPAGNQSGSQPANPSQSGNQPGNQATGQDPGAGGTALSDKPLEVLPPVAETAKGLPAPSEPAPLLSGSLPKPGSATGKLVDGWPGDIVALPGGTAVGSTSVSSSGNVLQVSADGVLSKPQNEVLDSFRQSLAAHGFVAVSAPAADGSVASSFSRGADTVTVSVSTTGTGASRFQLLGSLRTAAK